MKDSPVNQPHYTIKKVAEMLCVTPATIRRHIKAGELAYVEISKRKWVIPEDSLKIYLARRHRVLLEDKKDGLLESGT